MRTGEKSTKKLAKAVGKVGSSEEIHILEPEGRKPSELLMMKVCACFLQSCLHLFFVE